MTTQDALTPASELPVAVSIPAIWYFKADNCLRKIGGVHFTPYDNVGSWWGAFKTENATVADGLKVLCKDLKNAVWEISAEEYGQLTKTTIVPGERQAVPDKLAERIAANTAATATADVIREDAAMGIIDIESSKVENVDDIKVGEVVMPKPKRGRPPKSRNNLPIGSPIPRPNFDP